MNKHTQAQTQTQTQARTQDAQHTHTHSSSHTYMQAQCTQREKGKEGWDGIRDEREGGRDVVAGADEAGSFMILHGKMFGC